MSVKALSKAVVIVSLVAGLFVPAFSFAQTGPNSGIEQEVDSYFADVPVMIAIARCESGFRQFNNAGGVLYGGTGTMVGIFQLDATVHTARAQALGFDITTVNGNMGYARYLFGALGTDPWISSFGCWGSSSSSSSSTSSSTFALTENLSLGDVDPQVLTLQQILNRIGFTVAPSGPGSPGSETNTFGALTRAAVRSFQCAKGITCVGTEGTTGYGYVDPRTRAALQTATLSTNTDGATSTVSSAPTSTDASSTASSTLPTPTPVPTPAPTPVPTPTPSTPSASDQAALIAQYQAQITALLKIVSQLQAQITAKQTH